MTTYYVGIGGDDGNDGTTWALRKLTLNGAEDIPVAAGDTVYVGPGTYRGELEVDTVAGSSGSPITYIGDYTGANTDGVGGIVRLAGSDDDINDDNADKCIDVDVSYRTFQGFVIDTGEYQQIDIASGVTNIIIDECYFNSDSANAIDFNGTSGAHGGSCTVKNCVFFNGGKQGAILFDDDSVANDVGSVVENCIFIGAASGAIESDYVGGITVKNCTFIGSYEGVETDDLDTGQSVTVNNCVFWGCYFALNSDTVGSIVEDYNNFYNNLTDRTNVNTGANSTDKFIFFDPRWFMEFVHGGRLITPFDPASYNQWINTAGTSPTSTDIRGTGTLGAQREWGALEYDSTLFDKWVNRGMMGCG